MITKMLIQVATVIFAVSTVGVSLVAFTESDGQLGFVIGFFSALAAMFFEPIALAKHLERIVRMRANQPETGERRSRGFVRRLRSALR